MLSRLQFALTIMFHYMFPPLTIGLGVVLVYLEGMYLRTKDPLYESAAKFWTQDLRPELRPRRRHRHRDGVRVRHELGRLLAVRRRRVRLGPRGRRHLRVLPRVRLSRDAAVRLGPRRPEDAFLRHRDGRARRHLFLGLDHDRQLLAADAGRPCHSRARHQRPDVPAGRDRRFLGDGLQPVERQSARFTSGSARSSSARSS